MEFVPGFSGLIQLIQLIHGFSEFPISGGHAAHDPRLSADGRTWPDVKHFLGEAHRPFPC